MTPILTKVAPRYGSVTGGESITFTGTGFSSTTSDYTVIIDGIACSVTAATTTSVTCTIGERKGLPEEKLQIFIKNKGYVANQGVKFTYVSKWSNEKTWGGLFAPVEGESFVVSKGVNLLFDIDKSPKLQAVLVMGSLIFLPSSDATHHRTFDARYIFVKGGRMEVGTEEFPYTSKITITLHGKITDAYLPIYGNKVLGVRHGTLDMQGPERVPTWTQLGATAAEGATKITLKEKVDWVVGEEIGIASSSFEGRQAEKRKITAIDKTKPDAPVLTLDKALVYKHYGDL